MDSCDEFVVPLCTTQHKALNTIIPEIMRTESNGGQTTPLNY